MSLGARAGRERVEMNVGTKPVGPVALRQEGRAGQDPGGKPPKDPSGRDSREKAPASEMPKKRKTGFGKAHLPETGRFPSGWRLTSPRKRNDWGI